MSLGEPGGRICVCVKHSSWFICLSGLGRSWFLVFILVGSSEFVRSGVSVMLWKLLLPALLYPQAVTSPHFGELAA